MRLPAMKPIAPLVCLALASCAGVGQVAPATRPAASAEAPPPDGVQVDRVATLTVDVEDPLGAAARVRELLRGLGGTLTRDEMNAEPDHRDTVRPGEEKRRRTRVSLEARVPAPRLDEALAELARVGAISRQRITATDLSRRIQDNGLEKRQLEAQLARFQELLQQAHDLKDMLALEAEMSRVRGALDKVRADEQWLADHAAQSTLYLELQVPGGIAEESTFYPGLRASLLQPIGSAGTYLGAGFAFMTLSGRLTLDLDVYRRLGHDSPLDGADALTFSFNAASYGLRPVHRSYLLPYIGWSTGYAYIEGRNAFTLGALLGVDLIRVGTLLIAAEVRATALLGGTGPVAAGQGFLAAHLSF